MIPNSCSGGHNRLTSGPQPADPTRKTLRTSGIPLPTLPTPMSLAHAHTAHYVVAMSYRGICNTNARREWSVHAKILLQDRQLLEIRLFGP